MNAAASPAADDSPPDPAALMRSPRFLGLLALAAITGVLASVLAWGFLELVTHMQPWVFNDLPEALGFDHAPTWWPLPVLAIAGLGTALAISALPGVGGHIPADGLNPAPTQPIEVPGVIAAAVAGIGLGVVLGPEAPLIAMGGGLGLFVAQRVRNIPADASALLGAAGAIAAISFLFGSPIVAAVLMIEAAALGGARQRLVVIPGLLAAGLGSLVWLGLGSWSGLSTSAISLSPVKLQPLARPDVADFGWGILLAAAVAVGVFAIFRVGRSVNRIATPKPYLVVPAVGVAVAALAIAFSQATDKGASEVLFSGQDGLSPLVENPAAWSVSALVLLIAFKGAAYGISLGAFRGGPVFPAVLLGAAAGLLAAKLPGFSVTPAVAVGIAASVAAALRLPLTACVLAVILTSKAGAGPGPVIIVGAVAAYLVSIVLDRRTADRSDEQPEQRAALAH